MNCYYRNYTNVKKIQMHNAREKDLERQVELLKNDPHNESNYASKLNMLGREAYFIEYFDGIKLEDQTIEKVGPFEDPRKTVNFSKGYQRGAFLVEQGIVPEKYQEKNNKLKR